MAGTQLADERARKWVSAQSSGGGRSGFAEGPVSYLLFVRRSESPFIRATVG